MKIKRPITAVLCIIFTAYISHASAQAKKKDIVKKKATTMATKPIPPPPFATAQEIEDGKDFISKSDCLVCHKTGEKLVGPAYFAIAEKYPKNKNTVDTLSQKVINGGGGVWGPVPMIPHPAITRAEANNIVKYILTLNSKNPPPAQTKSE